MVINTNLSVISYHFTLLKLALNRVDNEHNSLKEQIAFNKVNYITSVGMAHTQTSFRAFPSFMPRQKPLDITVSGYLLNEHLSDYLGYCKSSFLVAKVTHPLRLLHWLNQYHAVVI